MDVSLEEIDQLLSVFPEEYVVVIQQKHTGSTDELWLVAYSPNVPLLFGMTPEEFSPYKNSNPLNLLMPDEQRRGKQTLHDGFIHQGRNDSAYQAIHKTLGSVWLRLRTNYRLTIDGCAACIMSLEKLFPASAHQDIAAHMLEVSLTDRLTNQAKVEEELRQKSIQLTEALADAERANHAKSDFLSTMSHDIRTPLNAIVNLANLLHDDLDDTTKLKEDINKMEVAAEFLLQLINDILDISAIEAGHVTLKPRVYTYATFLNYIKGIIVPLCENKDVNFVLDEGPTALDIYMDRTRFHQVFFNILSNAVKYTPPGGTVTFRTCNNVVHDGILTCDFVVSDTGCGMSQKFLERAFEPFEREDHESAYVGTGLGLAICKQLIDLMGGTIQIESEVGKGTTVTVHMDLVLATEEQKAQSQMELDSSYMRHVVLPNGQQPRILLAEDNLVNQEVLSRIVSKRNYLVERASNGKEAVEMIQAHDGSYYQMILMDVRMPIMDGLEATRIIRKLPDSDKSRIPIIAITADAFENDMTRCLEAGMNAGLTKPISPNSLYNMMANYIQTEG